MLVSDTKQTDSVIIYIYPFFFIFFSHTGYYTIVSWVPQLYSRSLLIIYFIYNSVYMFKNGKR